MKYFTFIGTGSFNQTSNQEGYEVISYHFNDDEMLVKSKFIQEAIVERFKKQLEAVYVFATDDAYAKHGEELKNHLKGVKVSFINIDKNINFEEFSTALLSNIYANDQIIIDVTHSFRYLPMKLLFALDYIENAKDVKIKHLYYGRMEGDNGYIEDIAKDYQMRKISDLLSQFNRTLIINAEDIKPYLSDDDETISDLMSALADFNEVTELCRFDDCFNTIDRILKACKIINSNPGNYQMIIPFVKKIRVIFKTISGDNEVYNKINFIKILFEHKRYQVAITFTDQLLREELIRYVFYPTSVNCDTYKLSQAIMSRTKLKYGSSKNNDYASLLNNREKELKKLKSNAEVYSVKINRFYSDLRNHINHGEKINKSGPDIRAICYGVLNIVRLLEGELNKK